MIYRTKGEKPYLSKGQKFTDAKGNHHKAEEFDGFFVRTDSGLVLALIQVSGNTFKWE